MNFNPYNLKGGRNKKTQEEISEEIKEKNPNIEITSEYKGGSKKADFICNLCKNEWRQTVNALLLTPRCPECQNNNKSRTKQEIIEDLLEENKENSAIKVFNKLNQKKDKIKCQCQICKDYFFHNLFNKLSENGCFKCSNALKRKDPKEYLKEVKKVNPNIRVLTEYIDSLTPIKVQCTKDECGCEWTVQPYNLINSNEKQRTGCPSCNQSKGEKKIEEFLKKRGIEHIIQHSYDDCKNVYPLKFDVYLPEFNLCIEYDGEHHYKPVYYSKYKTNTAEKQFEYRKKNDQIKNNYCKNNDIALLRIPYWDFDNIKEILEKELCLTTGQKQTTTP